MTHAWCSDPSRDAAVRAAEDGRDRPLPTLEDAIEAVTERRSDQTKGDEMSQGLRTERVVLEITGAPGWKVNVIGVDVESVRVVEEPLSDAWAQRLNRLTDERDAAIRERDNERLVRIGTDTDRDFARREKDAAIRHITELRTERDKLRARVAELEAASGGNSPETPEGSTQAASGGGGLTPHQRSVVQQLMDAAEDAQEFRLNAFSFNERVVKLRSAIGAARRLLTDPLLAQAASGGGEGQSVSAGTSSAPVGDSGQGSRVASGEPVAWGCDGPDGRLVHVSLFHPERDPATIVPLYRAPPQPRGWLTGEERDLIAGITDDDEYTEDGQNIAKALLARSSPPEVVLPENPYHPSGLREGFDHAIRIVRNELVNAGVPVKEVP